MSSQNLGSFISILNPGRQWIVEPDTIDSDRLYSLVGLATLGGATGALPTETERVSATHKFGVQNFRYMLFGVRTDRVNPSTLNTYRFDRDTLYRGDD
jgi:hypothetical protein